MDNGKETKNKKKRPDVSGIFLGVAAALFFICFSVTAVLNCKAVYRRDLDAYALDKASGVPKEAILEDYDRLIRYNNLGGPDKLEFRHFAMSETGRTHFEEVRTVFRAFETGLILFGLFSLAGIFLCLRKREDRPDPPLLTAFRTAGVLLTALPAALGLAAALAWDRFFVLFHEVVFDNDYWIFDETTDPIIKVLPDAFFYHEALLIAALILLPGAAFLIAAHAVKTRAARKA